jgi:hypothetical protein
MIRTRLGALCARSAIPSEINRRRVYVTTYSGLSPLASRLLGVAAARLILVSDTHLSASAPQAQANWDAVVGYVSACVPDLVIHLGDHSLDGAHHAAHLRYGRTQLDRLPTAWRAVPGNHDIGDNPWPGAPGSSAHKPVTATGTELAAAPHYRYWLWAAFLGEAEYAA